MNAEKTEMWTFEEFNGRKKSMTRDSRGIEMMRTPYKFSYYYS